MVVSVTIQRDGSRPQIAYVLFLMIGTQEIHRKSSSSKKKPLTANWEELGINVYRWGSFPVRGCLATQ